MSDSHVADLMKIYGHNICKSVQDEEFDHLLCIMKQLTLDGYAKLFTDSDIISIAAD